MLRPIPLLMTGLLALSVSAPVFAGPADHFRHWSKDRIEDRLDRLENRLDARRDRGRRDRLEDRIDRWEDRRDRAGLPVPPRLNRWERRSWRRFWCRRFDPAACTGPDR